MEINLNYIPVIARLWLMLCIYRTLNHIDRNALWIDLNAGDINRNASQRSADAYSFINLIRQILIRVSQDKLRPMLLVSVQLLIKSILLITTFLIG